MKNYIFPAGRSFLIVSLIIPAAKVRFSKHYIRHSTRIFLSTQTEYGIKFVSTDLPAPWKYYNVNSLTFFADLNIPVGGGSWETVLKGNVNSAPNYGDSEYALWQYTLGDPRKLYWHYYHIEGGKPQPPGGGGGGSSNGSPGGVTPPGSGGL